MDVPGLTELKITGQNAVQSYWLRKQSIPEVTPVWVRRKGLDWTPERRPVGLPKRSGAALIREQLKAGSKEYCLKPVKVICIMDYEEEHCRVPENKIVFQYRLAELETGELYGHQLSVYLVELPRVMKLTKNFGNPVAGWCQVFRNIANFARTREGRDGRFSKVVKEMKVRGMTDKEIKEYFSDMYTLEDYKPYIDGAAELGYRKGLAEGIAEGHAEGIAEGREKERSSIVLKMKELNIPTEQIMSITGLSAEEVK